MNNTDHFLMAVGACVAVTTAAVFVLRGPMRGVLAELCGSRERGDFWVTLASLCMLLAATAASTVPDTLLRRSAPDAQAVLQCVVLQCACGLAGVLVSLGVLTGAIVVFIRAFVRESHGAGTPMATLPPTAVTATRPGAPREAWAVDRVAREDSITRLLRRKREFWGEGEP